MGGFNTEMEVEPLKGFCDVFNLQNLIKEPTCFKSVLNPSSIDVILTNKRNFVHNSFAFETGLSDYHKMTITVLKTYVKKLKPKTIKYRSYKHFDDTSFKSELVSSLESRGNRNVKYDEFKTLFMEVLTKHAHVKEKVIRGNNAPFMNKMLSKAFMERSRLKNKYDNFTNEVNKVSYKKQRNFCTNLLKNVKKNYYNNLDINIFNDNKKVWKCIRPFFSDKQTDFQKEIILIEKDEITSNAKEVSEKFNNYFIDVIENLDIAPIIEETVLQRDPCVPIEEIVKKYSKHASIIKIK